jgi:hypothetical protein
MPRWHWHWHCTGSLQFLSVPLVTIFKNVTNIAIMAGDWYFYQQPTSLPIVLSLLLMLAGAVMAGLADIAFSPLGYTWMALNCLATAAYGGSTDGSWHLMVAGSLGCDADACSGCRFKLVPRLSQVSPLCCHSITVRLVQCCT